MVVDRTLYDVLGVEPNASQQTITKVWILSIGRFLNKINLIMWGGGGGGGGGGAHEIF